MINAAGERVWVKFHFKTQQGHRHWTNAESAEVVGKTRESTQEDLFEAIEKGDFPRWTVQVQVMTDAQASNPLHQTFRARTPMTALRARQSASISPSARISRRPRLSGLCSGAR